MVGHHMRAIISNVVFDHDCYTTDAERDLLAIAKFFVVICLIQIHD